MASEIRKSGYENSVVNFILIVLVGMNVLNHGSIILLVFAFANLLILSRKVKVSFDGQMLVLLLFFIISSITTFSFFSVKDAFIETVKLSNYFTVYWAAKAGYQVANDKNKYIRNTIFAIFLGLAINLGVFYFYNLKLGGGTISKRFLVNAWTGEEIRATLTGLISCVVVGYSFYGIFISRKLIVKLLCLFALGIMIALNFSTATRTPLIMFLIVYGFLLLVMLVFNPSKTYLKTVFCVLSFLLVLMFLISINAFGLKEFIYSSPLYSRLEESGLETSRTDIVKEYFKLMPQHLWGGGVLSAQLGKQPHNLWQQVYDIYGLFPMVLMLLSTLHVIAVFLSVLRQTKRSKIAMLFVAVMISMLLQCAMEPIITGFPILLWFLLMITGLANSWVADVKDGALPLS